jgi:hypothetical protein
MIAARDYVSASLDNLPCNLAGCPEPGGRVLSIYDYEVQLQFFSKVGKSADCCVPAGTPHQIPQKQ